MTTNSLIDLPKDYILVLHEIKESGEEEFLSLAEGLNVSQSRLRHIIQSLSSKGLVLINRSNWSRWGETWIHLSSKGKKAVNYI